MEERTLVKHFKAVLTCIVILLITSLFITVQSAQAQIVNLTVDGQTFTNDGTIDVDGTDGININAAATNATVINNGTITTSNTNNFHGIPLTS
jgi:hypothetical protein|tara:strand:+ start:754 stop:1032 length:279 start_codon:yes stop_codon:yes gene_type:complete